MTMCSRIVKVNLRLEKSVGRAFACLSPLNETWKVNVYEFSERSAQPPPCTSAILLEGLGFFISGKRAGKDSEDE